jgi:hypothetical protein
MSHIRSLCRTNDLGHKESRNKTAHPAFTCQYPQERGVKLELAAAGVGVHLSDSAEIAAGTDAMRRWRRSRRSRRAIGPLLPLVLSSLKRRWSRDSVAKP